MILEKRLLFLTSPVFLKNNYLVHFFQLNKLENAVQSSPRELFLCFVTLSENPVVSVWVTFFSAML